MARCLAILALNERYCKYLYRILYALGNEKKVVIHFTAVVWNTTVVIMRYAFTDNYRLMYVGDSINKITRPHLGAIFPISLLFPARAG